MKSVPTDGAPKEELYQVPAGEKSVGVANTVEGSTCGVHHPELLANSHVLLVEWLMNPFSRQQAA